MDVNHSIVTMQTSAVLNLEKASATFDHSRLNMNSSSINMRRYWYPDSNSSILFTNNSLLHAVSGANGNSQITGNAPATYVENVVNAGTNYANHIGSETLVRGDFVEFRNSIFETYGSDTHRFRIKSNQTQDPDNPILWDGIYFYDCEQDFIDSPFQYVNFEYLDKISFNNCDFTLDHCNFSNSGQLFVENNSSVQVVGSSYSTNDGPIYVSHSAIDIQSCQINNNRLGGVYLNYPRTSQGNNWCKSSLILACRITILACPHFHIDTASPTDALLINSSVGVSSPFLQISSPFLQISSPFLHAPKTVIQATGTWQSQHRSCCLPRLSQ